MDDAAILAEMEARRAREIQRQREMVGINGAAEAGVFSPGRPKELDVVDQARRWQAEQWALETRPLDYTAVPVTFDDRPIESSPRPVVEAESLTVEE